MRQSSVSGPQDLDVNAKTVQLVNLISEIGPDICEISRRLGQFKESVRYRYEEKIVKRSFEIKADVDYGALGLRRVVAKVRVPGTRARYVRELFETMSDTCYLVAYAGTMPSDVYLVQGGVPVELTAEFHRFMEELKEKGIFSEVESFDCDWFRVVPMRAEYFNFDEGVWDFDWSNPPPVDERAARATISERQTYDRTDLLITKELQKDSDRSMVEIQAAIKEVNGVDINYKTLGWHYKNHVLGHHLIRDYSVSWNGIKSHFGPKRYEGLGKHEYVGVSLLVRETSHHDSLLLRSQLNRLPFQWSEAAGEAYYSQFFFPLGMANEAFEYLKVLLSPYGKRAEIFLLDRRQMYSYTVCYRLWDERSGRWTFDPTGVLSRLESSVLKVRND